MAYNKYRNKYSRGLSNKLIMRNLRWFILAVVVLVVLLFVLLKGDDSDKVVSSGGDGAVALPKDVVINDEASADPTTAQSESDEISDDDENITEEEMTDDVISKVEDQSANAESDIDQQQASATEASQGGLSIPMDEAKKMMQNATEDLQNGKVISARETLNDVLSLGITPLERERVKNQLAELSNMWLFSKSVFPGDKLTSAYPVESGDSLGAIGGKYKVSPEFLMRINGIDDARKLRAGQSIKVVYGPFNAVVTKSTFTLDVYLQNTYVRSYKVGIGLPGKDTPSGKWQVKSDGKLITPPWPNPDGGIVYPDDPEYPLGSRWIGIEGIDEQTKLRSGFGIHGTKDPHTIGTKSSQGCVRLYNGEVVELYDMLVENFSVIIIRD